MSSSFLKGARRMAEERNDNLHMAERVTFHGEVIELAFPIELRNSDISVGVDNSSEMAFLLFKIIQKQLDVLNTKIKALEPKYDKSHPFADDVMMSDPTPIKCCKICKHFLLWGRDNLTLPGAGVCRLDGRICDVGHPGCNSFDRNA